MLIDVDELPGLLQRFDELPRLLVLLGLRLGSLGHNYRLSSLLTYFTMSHPRNPTDPDRRDGTRSDERADASREHSMAMTAATEPTVEVKTLEDCLSVLTNHVVSLMMGRSFAWRG